ncbi:MAG: TIGR02996 domain-containing protein [Myxococcaceae bacterium]|nr:TIGR02996 domain-containing protein [Myxococcaceae bacterium]
MWLEGPRRLLEEGRPAAALEGLLDAWRSRRLSALANVIDTLSDGLTRALPRLEGRTRKGLQGLWLDLANERRDVDVGRLLACFATPPWVAVGQRIERLAQLDDPRVSKAFAAFVEELPTAGGIGSARWTLLFSQLGRAKDGRVRRPLERRLSIADPRFLVTEQVHPLARQVLALLPDEQPSGEELGEVASLAAAVARALSQPLPPADVLLRDASRPRRAGSEAELLHVIYERPEDDTPRLVYSDWLQEQGDPRAELLVLQLKPRRTGKELRRERELVRTHGRAWLGPLEPAIERRSEVFSRGFLSAARVVFLTSRQRDALVGHPAWNTLTRLDRSDSVDGGFLRQTELRGLESLHVLSEREFPEVLARKWPFRRLTALGLASDAWLTLPRLEPQLVPCLAAVTVNAASGTEERLHRLLSSALPVFGRLERFTLNGLQSPALLEALKGWPKLTLAQLNFQVRLVFHRATPALPWVLDVLPALHGWFGSDDIAPIVRRFLPQVVGVVTPSPSWGERYDRVSSRLDALRREQRLDWVPRSDAPVP